MIRSKPHFWRTGSRATHHLNRWTVWTSDNSVMSIKRMCIDPREQPMGHLGFDGNKKCYQPLLHLLSTAYGAYLAEVDPPAEKSAMSTPSNASSVVSSIVTSWPLNCKTFPCRTCRRKVTNLIDWKSWFFQHFDHLSTNGTCSTDNSNCVSHSKTSFKIF